MYFLSELQRIRTSTAISKIDLRLIAIRNLQLGIQVILDGWEIGLFVQKISVRDNLTFDMNRGLHEKVGRPKVN